MPIGRHKGKFYKEIIEEDNDYCSWASQIEKPGEPLRDFVHFLKLNWKESDREDSNAKGSEECKICFSAAINTVLVPCGHRAMCLSCAERLDECPYCKAKISLAQQCFDA